jgi:hypothetical protein
MGRREERTLQFNQAASQSFRKAEAERRRAGFNG